MKVVVYGTKWIGDAVISAPAIRGIRSMFPDAELTLYSSEWAKGLFEECDFVDRVLGPTSGAQTPGFINEIKIWRREKFDLAVLFRNSFRSAIIAKAGAAKSVFGYANEGRGFLLSEAFEKPEWKDKRHEVFYYLNLIENVAKSTGQDFSFSEQEPEIHFTVSERRRQDAREILKSAGIDCKKKIVGLGVGSQNSDAKRWPAVSFAKLSDRIAMELETSVVLLGSESDTVVADEVAGASKHPPVILTGKTALSEAVAILSELDVFISNDMGLAHVSSAVGTKTVTIFGPTNPITTRPINGSILRREDVDCSPCMLRDCPIDHRCMTRIGVGEVFGEICAALEE